MGLKYFILKLPMHRLSQLIVELLLSCYYPGGYAR